MAIEIERRFIVKGDEWKSFAKKPKNFKQGYISTNFDEWVIRTRIINNKKSELTLKKYSDLMMNHEFE